jgi:hypothetical protein
MNLSVAEFQTEKAQTREKSFQAEVFFNYTVLLSASEDGAIFIIGHLTMKNTGMEPLYHPIVCLRSIPADKVDIRGQIVPANMTETLGVQSTQGPKGWRYAAVEEVGKSEPGELWICPIQPMHIEPQGVETLQNLQFRVARSVKETVTVDGLVTFQEPQVTFSSNNRIMLSF